MASLTLRLTDEKYLRLKEMAAQRNISLNSLIDEAATVMLAEHDTLTRFKARAAKADVPHALSLLDKA